MIILYRTTFWGVTAMLSNCIQRLRRLARATTGNCSQPTTKQTMEGGKNYFDSQSQSPTASQYRDQGVQQVSNTKHANLKSTMKVFFPVRPHCDKIDGAANMSVQRNGSNHNRMRQGKCVYGLHCAAKYRQHPTD